MNTCLNLKKQQQANRPENPTSLNSLELLFSLLGEVANVIMVFEFGLLYE